MTTRFEKHSEILYQLLHTLGESPEWGNFFTRTTRQQLTKITFNETTSPQAQHTINAIWLTYCELLEINPDEPYDNLFDTFAASTIDHL